MVIVKTLVDVLVSFALIASAFLILVQIFKILRAKNTDDFSLLSYGGFNVFQLGMLLHGYFTHDLVLMIGMALCFVVNLITLYLIVRYRTKRYLK